MCVSHYLLDKLGVLIVNTILYKWFAALLRARHLKATATGEPSLQLPASCKVDNRGLASVGSITWEGWGGKKIEKNCNTGLFYLQARFFN